MYKCEKCKDKGYYCEPIPKIFGPCYWDGKEVVAWVYNCMLCDVFENKMIEHERQLSSGSTYGS